MSRPAEATARLRGVDSPFSSPLTAKQANVLRFIEAHLADTGSPPTLREIAAAFGFTGQAAFLHLVALQRHGYIARPHNQQRAITVLRRAPLFLVAEHRDAAAGAA